MKTKTLLYIVLFALLSSCNIVSDDELDTIAEPRVWAYFNSTGTREANKRDIGTERALVDRIDSATATLDACIYGFSNQDIIDAVVRAHYRGVVVRVVGDARHMGYNAYGYRVLQENHIPIQVGNEYHIMHNKFFIIDDLFVFVGTGNITETGFKRNNNNFLQIDSPYVAADFKAEFNQMFAGKFSTAKERLENGTTYEVGDTIVEVYFSPQEDAMGRILREIELVTDNLHFTIFAFTKDQIGSAFINKHREFQAINEENGDDELPILERPKRVTGILDRSQIHGNFLYHEVYRLAAAGLPMRLESNETSRLPGDYQAGGGRLHSKTMILDRGTPNARVITGSFNWSSAATIANDEVLIILRGERITDEYYREFLELWNASKTLSAGICGTLADNDYDSDEGPACAEDVEPGDIVISEIGWHGWNGRTDPSDHSGRFRDPITNDEFIELYNTTDRAINLSLYTVTNGNDFAVGFTPGTVIQPKQHFLVLDHNIEPYSDTNPQRSTSAYQNADYVMNLANDPRFPRLNLKDSSLDLRLVDTRGREIDRAGNGLTPFAGGPVIANPEDPEVVGTRSMERKFVDGVPAADGTDRDNWYTTTVDEGGANVNPEFRDIVFGTPGEPNSPY